MDLSAIIFVVLALAWAVYLIPKALKHHDEMASDRLVEGHSDKVRILARHGKKFVTTAAVATDETVTAVVEVTESAAEPESESAVSASPSQLVAAPGRPRLTRASARKAARRRRRVLGVLLLSLAVVAGLAGFAIVPWWSTSIPGGLVVLFLGVARLSVRSTRRRAAAPVRQRAPQPGAASAEGADQLSAPIDGPIDRPDALSASVAVDPTEALVDQLSDEDTVGIRRKEVEAALADDGSLWDPLPMTLPTYVNKARARRTVRTIALTGINSSGHDEFDTAIARDAQELETAERDADGSQRRVVGG